MRFGCGMPQGHSIEEGMSAQMSTEIRIVIIGAVGNCIDIQDAIVAGSRRDSSSNRRCIGYLDDDPQLAGKTIQGLPVLGPLEHIAQLDPDVLLICGIGSPRSFLGKRDLIESFSVADDRWISVVHPSATISPSAKIGLGVTILANVAVCANSVIGNHVMVLPNSVINHDCRIGDYSCLASGVSVSGSVAIGDQSYIGTGATVRDGIAIGRKSLIGMGSVVTKDIPAGVVVVGVPARIVRDIGRTGC